MNDLLTFATDVITALRSCREKRTEFNFRYALPDGDAVTVIFQMQGWDHYARPKFYVLHHTSQPGVGGFIELMKEAWGDTFEVRHSTTNDLRLKNKIVVITHNDESEEALSFGTHGWMPEVVAKLAKDPYYFERRYLRGKFLHRHKGRAKRQHRFAEMLPCGKIARRDNQGGVSYT